MHSSHPLRHLILEQHFPVSPHALPDCHPRIFSVSVLPEQAGFLCAFHLEATSQGILIEGLETAGEEAKEPEHKKIPLTAEEEAYLKNYLEELPVVDEVDADSVFEALAAGDQRALQTLTSYYMKTAADMAVEMNIEEMQLADLIQEANLCLIQALGTAGDECRDEKWLLSEMRKGTQLVLEEQTQRKFEDDSLVARVEKLEHAVRDLNDGEDEKNAFTIDELAIILDMKVDEIRDILRLTGDDN